MSRFTAFDRSQLNSLAFALGALLTCAFAFGGASRQHELRLAIVELASLPLLVIAANSFVRSNRIGEHKFALVLLACCVALPLVQLIPLPPGIWTNLPGRQEMVTALDLAGQSPGWVPVSVTPDRTWRSFLALLPPVAAFVAILVASTWLRLRVVQALLFATSVAILLGAAQLASGDTLFLPWRTTAAGTVAGFFANRNHFATLCLVSLPFAVALGAAPMRRRSPSGQAALIMSGLYIALVIISIGVIRSRAGIVFLPFVLGAAFFAAWLAVGRGRPKLPLLSGVIGAGAAVIAVGIFAIRPILERFDALSIHEGRFDNWPTVILAANSYLPIGSGLGSFDAVYRSVEPLVRLDATYFNQAHNDYLETWLETGWIGIALVIAFLVWFGRRARSAWSGPASTARDLQRAASIAIMVILLHSLVDYPLRTAAIATVFAICCALLELAGQPDEAAGERRRRSI